MSGIFTKIYERTQTNRGNNATERDYFNDFKGQVLASRGSRARTKGNAVTPFSEDVNFNPYFWKSDKESDTKLGKEIFEHYTNNTLEEIKKENKNSRSLDINQVHTTVPTTFPSMPLLFRLLAIVISASIMLVGSLFQAPFVGLKNIYRKFKGQPLQATYIQEFFKALSFSTLDKGNPPFPSPFQFNNKTTIMEMGTPVYCKNPFTGSFSIEPLFKEALDIMKEKPEDWLYVNYLENNFKEKKMVAALKQLGQTQENFFYMQMPPKQGINKVFGKKKTITQEHLIDLVTNPKSSHYHLSEKIWRKALNKNTQDLLLPEEKKNFLLENVFDKMGLNHSLPDAPFKLTKGEVNEFNAILIEQIRASVQPKRMNFTCKDGIDRGHAGKLMYAANKVRQDLLRSHEEYLEASHHTDSEKKHASGEKLESAFKAYLMTIQQVKTYQDTRARIVKGREANTNIHSENFTDFIKHATTIIPTLFLKHPEKCQDLKAPSISVGLTAKQHSNEQLKTAGYCHINVAKALEAYQKPLEHLNPHSDVHMPDPQKTEKVLLGQQNQKQTEHHRNA